MIMITLGTKWSHKYMFQISKIHMFIHIAEPNLVPLSLSFTGL